MIYTRIRFTPPLYNADEVQEIHREEGAVKITDWRRRAIGHRKFSQRVSSRQQLMQTRSSQKPGSLQAPLKEHKLSFLCPATVTTMDNDNKSEAGPTYDLALLALFTLSQRRYFAQKILYRWQTFSRSETDMKWRWKPSVLGCFPLRSLYTSQH